MSTIYRERSGGSWEFWTYSEGQRVFVSEAWARREAGRGARIVTVP